MSFAGNILFQRSLILWNIFFLFINHAMKKLLSVLVGISCAFAAQAQEAPSPYVVELGVSQHHELYEEFDQTGAKLMQEAGPMMGLRLSVSRKDSSNGRWTLSAEVAQGNSTYTGSYWGGSYGDLRISGLSRTLLDIQGVYAHSAPEWQGVSVLAGVGYRRLTDNLQEAGPGGYKRVNDRYYVILGAEKAIHFENWAVTPGAQYKHLLRSSQFSDLFGGLNARQKSGHGAEFYVTFEQKGDERAMVIKPFVRLWDIADSEVVQGTYEPQNTTREVGLAVSWRF